MQGIDVSNNNGAVNWAKAKADGVDFAWVKATEGRTFNDSHLLDNLFGARKVGINVGAYHYAQPASNSAESEADHFLRAYRAHPGDLLPVLDFEVPGGMSPRAMSAWAARWMDLVQQGLHVEAVLYTYPYFLRDKMDAGMLRGRKLWYADYTGTPGKFKYASFAKGLDIVAQQYTSSGHVNGVNGRVDMNYAKSLGPITAPSRKQKVAKPGVLPGPAKKPRWFWAAVRTFLARRKTK